MKNRTGPPKAAEWIVYLMSRSGIRQSLLGDLEEEYHQARASEGKMRANLWYMNQASVPFFHFILSRLIWNMIMLKNYLKVALRNIKKHKVYAFINIAGLSVSLTAFILISLFVQYEFSFDKYHAFSDRIYRIIQHQPKKNYMNSDYFAVTQGPLGPTLKERYPEVITAARMNKFDNVLLTYGEKSFLENDFYFADPEIFEIFSINLEKGNSQYALTDPRSIIVSSKMAKKYFGNKDPIGKVIQGQNSREFVVTGVLEDMPNNSHFKMEFIAPFEVFTEIQGMNADNWTPGWYCYTYCLLDKRADPHTLENKLVSLSAEVFAKNRIESKLVLQPLQKIHLYSNINDEISANGNIKYIFLFSSIALLILIIACINYMNLGTARSLQRSKEVGIRKVVGAQKSHLVKQFLSESLILTVIAFILSILLVWTVLPVFSTYFERDIVFNLMGSAKFLLTLCALVFFTGILSGFYPAFLISSFKPKTALTSVLNRGSKSAVLRYSLVVLQFTISIILIICTLVVKNQLAYIQQRDVGYSKDQIVILRLPSSLAGINMETIKTELKKNPQVLSASGSGNLPNDITSFNRFERPSSEGPLLSIYTGVVDHDFIELYGLEIIKGRNFSRDYPSDERDAVLINETAAKALEWETPLGQRLRHRNGRNPEVIGILKDFNFHSLHNEIAPLCLYLYSNSSYYLSLGIKTDNLPETLDFVENQMETFFAGYPFEFRFFDDIFDQAYRAEQKLGDLFIICALMAIFIACLGLFGLVAFTAEQRTKEIGIRKVVGASVSSIIHLLSTQLLRWVLLANVIAWPIAYLAMHKWLQNFAFRAKIGIEIFVVSAFITLFIALLTVSYQSIKSATRNPIDSLRYE
jgi:putative ABC transport system permease protein